MVYYDIFGQITRAETNSGTQKDLDEINALGTRTMRLIGSNHSSSAKEAICPLHCTVYPTHCHIDLIDKLRVIFLYFTKVTQLPENQ